MPFWCSSWKASCYQPSWEPRLRSMLGCVTMRHVAFSQSMYVSCPPSCLSLKTFHLRTISKELVLKQIQNTHRNRFPVHCWWNWMFDPWKLCSAVLSCFQLHSVNVDVSISNSFQVICWFSYSGMENTNWNTPHVVNFPLLRHLELPWRIAIGGICSCTCCNVSLTKLLEAAPKC